MVRTSCYASTRVLWATVPRGCWGYFPSHRVCLRCLDRRHSPKTHVLIGSRCFFHSPNRVTKVRFLPLQERCPSRCPWVIAGSPAVRRCNSAAQVRRRGILVLFYWGHFWKQNVGVRDKEVAGFWSVETWVCVRVCNARNDLRLGPHFAEGYFGGRMDISQKRALGFNLQNCLPWKSGLSLFVKISRRQGVLPRYNTSSGWFPKSPSGWRICRCPVIFKAGLPSWFFFVGCPLSRLLCFPNLPFFTPYSKTSLVPSWAVLLPLPADAARTMGLLSSLQEEGLSSAKVSTLSPFPNFSPSFAALRMVAHPLVLGVADAMLAPYCERIQLHIGMFRRLCPGLGVGWWKP